MQVKTTHVHVELGMASMHRGAFILKLSILKLFASLTSALAPCCRSYFARPSYPSIHASSAVDWNLLLALTPAPCYRRSLTTGSCPAPHASNAIECTALHLALLIRWYALHSLNLLTLKGALSQYFRFILQCRNMFRAYPSIFPHQIAIETVACIFFSYYHGNVNHIDKSMLLLPAL